MSKFSKQISLGIDPMTGKRIRKWIHADTKLGLKQKEKEAIADFAKNGTVSSLTYEQYEEKWYNAYHGDITPRTHATNKSVLNHNNVLHGKKMKDIIRTDLQKIIKDSWDHPSFCRRYASMMKSMWECAVADGVCPKNIAIGLKLPKNSSSSRRPLTKEELEGIKKADLDVFERFLVDVLLQFGLRPGEAFALNKQAFDRKERTLTIDKAVSYNGVTPYIKSTKTGVTRVLPVPDSFWSKIPKIKTLYFFLNKDDQLMTITQRRAFQEGILAKINTAMGGTDKIRKTTITLYNFRHHKASLIYYLPGVSLKKKAAYLGHNEEMFLKIYSHMMEEKEDSEVLRQAVDL